MIEKSFVISEGFLINVETELVESNTVPIGEFGLIIMGVDIVDLRSESCVLINLTNVDDLNNLTSLNIIKGLEIEIQSLLN